MKEEQIKKRLDEIWSALPKIGREDIRAISREQFDSLCRSMMRIGQLNASSDIQDSIKEYVQKI